ncbi:plant virulence effector HPE1-like domain-containing protein [Ciceribacter sp. RN22]|uniref:plant virulence effector HPE1-like domain-containing protein n=1 Tax=Ciceribacter sp. RN22 TaxID=2954932 RepID=UPI002093B19C|nr:plant virulence effector HPE1-like domain-containing protein [Ciceribacter sp. RN22]MCO6177290.1 hypothetical protein [Ciceribacter sp. RN22]
MRRLILTAATILATGPAMASSVEVIHAIPRAESHSVEVMHCQDCPPPAAVKKNAYVVPTLPAGEQKAEIRDVDGERKLIRTEAWMGGSPVVFVNKADGWATNGSIVTAAIPGEDRGSDVGIDVTATTAAVGGEAGAATATGPAMLDTSGFELRLP